MADYLPYPFELDSPDYTIVYEFIHRKIRCPEDQRSSKTVYDLLVHRSADSGDVRAAIKRIIDSPEFVSGKGRLFLNRCIYTAINPLHIDPSRREELKQLVLSLPKAHKNAQNGTTRRLRRQLHIYTESELYKSVLRQTKLMNATENDLLAELFGDLLQEYSFLYFPTMITPDIEALESNRKGRNGKSGADYDLTAGMRRRKLERICQMRQDLQNYWMERKHNRSGNPVNPTRLSNEQLDLSIREYHTRKKGSFREFSYQFRNRHRPEQTLDRCRLDVLEYMANPLGKLSSEQENHYKEKFQRALNGLGEGDGFMESTVIQAFKKILDEIMFATCEPDVRAQKLKREVEILTPCKFVGILLNLVLGCPKVIYTLEKRLASIFIYAEEKTLSAVSWLIQLFEYMNLAIVMNARHFLNFNYHEIGRMPESIVSE